MSLQDRDCGEVQVLETLSLRAWRGAAQPRRAARLSRSFSGPSTRPLLSTVLDVKPLSSPCRDGFGKEFHSIAVP